MDLDIMRIKLEKQKRLVMRTILITTFAVGMFAGGLLMLWIVSH